MQQNIMRAIDAYVENPNKASWSDWQLFQHHGEKGIKRALCLKYYLITAQTAQTDSFWQILDDFSDRSIKASFLYQIDTANGVHNPRECLSHSDLKLMGLPWGKNLSLMVFYNRQADLLNGGNLNPSSLRSYIKKVCETSRYVPQTIRRQQSTSMSRYGFLFDRVDCPFDLDEPSIAVSVKELKLKKTSNESAHTIRVYSNRFDDKTLYFSKDLNQRNRLAELRNYAVEIMYANLWQWFLGKRISSSMLRLDENGRVSGISSKGLPYFIEFASVTTEQALWHKGLVSIIFYSYLLMENDLHTKNIGLTIQYDDEASKGIVVFGKIDHDYIASNWGVGGKNFTDQFPLNKIKLVISVPEARTFQQLFAHFRFSPGTENSFWINLAHALRTKPGTSRNRLQASVFLTGLVQRHYQRELKKTVEHFIKKSKTLYKLDRHMKGILQSLKMHNVPTDKAEEVYQVLFNRIRSVAR
ncbi:hypothetical protein P0136_03370 [Lentisphaerota bacterium ZTH]|nr:hypothetical protein JYG24_05500 [Lentisphaerota bacterium]WET07040.1 hypothetical protein P0136_03370 [Lentisphaerota bacterium ZTH]